MNIDHRFMQTDALIRSFHIATAAGNTKLVEEIKVILKERNVPVPDKAVPVRIPSKGQQTDWSFLEDQVVDPLKGFK